MLCDKPLLSVVVPVYGVESYLDRCVQSLVLQSYENLEIILVDDGSPDGCPALCDGWARRDERIRVIHQANAGLSGARNSGLDAATGGYIAFVDSDDHVAPEMMQRLMTAALEGDFDMVQMGFMYEDAAGNRTARSLDAVRLEGREAVLEGLLGVSAGRENTCLLYFAWGKVYKKEIWDGLRFPAGMTYEDMAVMPAVCLRCCRAAVLSDCDYYYNTGNDSAITRRHTRNTVESLCRQPELWARWLEPYPKYRPYIHERYCSVVFQLLRELKKAEYSALYREFAPALKKNYRTHYRAFRRSEAWKKRARSRRAELMLFGIWPGGYYLAYGLYRRVMNAAAGKTASWGSMQ